MKQNEPELYPLPNGVYIGYAESNCFVPVCAAKNIRTAQRAVEKYVKNDARGNQAHEKWGVVRYKNGRVVDGRYLHILEKFSVWTKHELVIRFHRFVYFKEFIRQIGKC